MAALTKDRATPERDGRRVIDPIGPTTVIHAGAMYMLNEDGDAVPADPAVASAPGVLGMPRAVALRSASGPDGDTHVEGALGVFRVDNSATFPVSRLGVHALCNVVDDHTVRALHDPGVLAAVVVDLDDTGVRVRVGGM